MTVKVKCKHCGFECALSDQVPWITCPECVHRIENPRCKDTVRIEIKPINAESEASSE